MDPPAASAEQRGPQAGLLAARSSQEVRGRERQPARPQETGEGRQHPQQREGADPDGPGGARHQQRRHSDSEQGTDSRAEIRHDQSGATATDERHASAGELHALRSAPQMLTAAIDRKRGPQVVEVKQLVDVRGDRVGNQQPRQRARMAQHRREAGPDRSQHPARVEGDHEQQQEQPDATDQTPLRDRGGEVAVCFKRHARLLRLQGRLGGAGPDADESALFDERERFVQQRVSTRGGLRESTHVVTEQRSARRRLVDDAC